MPVARPDSSRNTTDRREIVGSARWSPVAITIPQANTVMMTVRMAVARFDGTPATPIFARIAVAAAATAERDAKNSQLIGEVYRALNMSRLTATLTSIRSKVRSGQCQRVAAPRLDGLGQPRVITGRAVMTRQSLQAAALVAALACLVAAPAAAQRYTAKQTGNVVELQDTTAQMVVPVVTTVGRPYR